MESQLTDSGSSGLPGYTTGVRLQSPEKLNIGYIRHIACTLSNLCFIPLLQVPWAASPKSYPRHDHHLGGPQLRNWDILLPDESYLKRSEAKDFPYRRLEDFSQRLSGQYVSLQTG